MTLLLIITIVLYISLKDIYGDKSRKRFTMYMSIAIVFFSGFRNIWLGNDTYAYLRSMERSVETSWDDVLSVFLLRYFSPGIDGKDPGYAVYEKLFSSISANYTAYLITVAACTIIPMSIIIYRNTETLKQMLFTYIFYIVMFFGYVPNSAIRQSLAIGLIHFSFLFIQKKKIIPFFFIVLAASTLHKTALIGVLFYLLYKYIKVDYLYRYALLAFAIVLILGNYMTNFLVGFGDVYDAYARDYFALSGKSKPFMVIILFGGLSILSYFAPKVKGKIESQKIYITASFLVMFIVPLVRIDPSYIRLSAYFGILYAIYISRALESLSHKNSLVYTIIVAIFLFKGVLDDRYKFNWQYMKINDRYANVAFYSPSHDNLIKNTTYVFCTTI